MYIFFILHTINMIPIGSREQMHMVVIVYDNDHIYHNNLQLLIQRNVFIEDKTHTYYDMNCKMKIKLLRKCMSKTQGFLQSL